MEIKTHFIKDLRAAEVITDGIIINSADEALDLLGNLYYQGFDKIIIHEQNISADFFDLQNGMAGEILQKFSNYRVQLAVVGDFTKHTRKSVDAFIYESNKGRQVNFLTSVAEVLKRFSR
jgi:hypothetical protein